MNSIKFIVIGILFICSNIFSQTPPSDFKLVGTTAGVTPWSISKSLTILSNGQTEYVKIKSYPHQILKDTVFTISSSDVQLIWKSIQDNQFFNLGDTYTDDTIKDGSKAVFTITANGTTKQVIVKNITQQAIQNIINTINSAVPADLNLKYSPPEKFNIIPTDPCRLYFGNVYKSIKKKSLGYDVNKIDLLKKTVRSLNTETQIPHGGVEIGYEMSLSDAVATGRAALQGKGEYFGDGVSITGDNTKNFPPPDNTIHIKLNLEFFGPCDNSGYEIKVVGDIYKKWNGQQTSSGKTIQMDVEFISHPETNSPPGTPGFDDIKLQCGIDRSVCDGLGSTNTDGVIGGTWDPTDNEVGVFGHEAGHLMGLDDQYIDWNKQPDGSWKKSGDGTTLSSNDFVNLYNSKMGTNLKASDFSKDNVISIPLDGHDNDLMANVGKPPLQSDIDYLASKAGLIIDIDSGDILSDTDNYGQNLLITHSGNMFLNPGEKKTLYGIYVACIDHFKGIPDSAVVFDVAPSLDKWDGILSAQYLTKLVKHIDSIQYYCGYYDQFAAQYAIWRITDNVLSEPDLVDSIFKNAGLNVSNQFFDFPKLTNNSSSHTVSQVYVPDELFIPDIKPKSIQSSLGDNINFSANILKPIGLNYTTDYTWYLDKPEQSTSQISSNGAINVDKKGVYSISVKINITDSLNSKSEYSPDKYSYAVVPDKFTETFEHTNLTDKFQWETFGDANWQIVNDEAETGSHSVMSGNVTNGQSTVLAIDVNLPQDSLIEFAVKMITEFGDLEFRIDSNYTDLWYNSLDWKFFNYNIPAGKHRLTWTLTNYLTGSSIAWLDNIFFPTNSVATGINDKSEIPSSFSLAQNYPNPFNPFTIIRYSIPKSSKVSLKVFDILGSEISNLVSEVKSAGNYEVKFDGANLPSGVYFCRLQAGSYVKTIKMILLK